MRWILGDRREKLPRWNRDASRFVPLLTARNELCGVPCWCLDLSTGDCGCDWVCGALSWARVLGRRLRFVVDDVAESSAESFVSPPSQADADDLVTVCSLWKRRNSGFLILEIRGFWTRESESVTSEESGWESWSMWSLSMLLSVK